MTIPPCRILPIFAAVTLLVLPAVAEITVIPLDARADDGGDLLRVTVVDGASGKAIPEFRVVLGTRIAIGVEQKFSERHPDEEIVNWQPHTTRLGEDGRWERPLARAYDPLALRIEADGYVPQRHLWLDTKAGSQEVRVRLARDPGIRGKVALPDGAPAAGALIGVALVQRNLRIEGHRFAGFGEKEAEKPGDRWRRPTMVVADENGVFTVPTETDPASALVAIHEGGIAEMFYADFVDDQTVALSKWGGISGVVTFGEAPAEGVEVTFGVQKYGYGYPDMLSQGGAVKTDAAGKFEIERVAPGMVQVSLFEFFPQEEDNRLGGFQRPPAGAFSHVTVEPGKVATVTLGGADLRRSK